MAIIFNLFTDNALAQTIEEHCEGELGKVTLHQFPDKETCIKIDTDIKDRDVILVTTLDHPNEKLLPLLFFAKTAKDLGAKNIGIVSPYLAYMRQDKQFHAGEGITAHYFAELISRYFDWLITVEPHLHRIHSLNEIYNIPSLVLHAGKQIAEWIKNNVNNPILIGPDAESMQWVDTIAKDINIPCIIAEKIRTGDKQVAVTIANIENYKNYTPVLVDDIIATGLTMIETIKHIKQSLPHLPICIGIHAIFAGNAYAELLQTGSKIVTCNTIKHPSNQINLNSLIAKSIKKIQK